MTTSLSFRNCSEAYCKGEPPWCLTAVITRFLSFFSFSAKKLSTSRLLLTASVIIFLSEVLSNIITHQKRETQLYNYIIPR